MPDLLSSALFSDHACEGESKEAILYQHDGKMTVFAGKTRGVLNEHPRKGEEISRVRII